jgi:hypothetical protein
MTIITNGETGLSVLTDINTFHDEMSREAVLAREGFGRHARNTWNTLSMWSDDYMAANGFGGTDFFPRSITASQSGNTVTATTSVFVKLYVGALIQWASGQEAIITAIDNAGASYAAITTCTVDRSQTVTSSAATIRAKHLVGVSYGDSLGSRIAPVLGKLLWRSLGFGGYVIHANCFEQAGGNQIATVTLAGGASDATSDADFADFPWGAHWDVPSSGSITFALQSPFSNGVAFKQRNTLEPEEKKHDTAVLIWKRAAGAFTVERKRYHDASWEAVATVADASTGTANYNSAKYTHALRSDWQYRVTSTSGTIQVVSMTFRNDTAPGFVLWPLYRGGELISDFAALSSAELGELCTIHGQPDFRCIFASDAIPGDTDASDFAPEIEADRDLWAAAAPKMDHVWFTGWETSANDAEQVAWNDAVTAEAKANDDVLIPFYELFGDFTTSGSLRGWVEDTVHPSSRGEIIMGHMLLRGLGLADHPTIRDGRDVNAARGDFASLNILGQNVRTSLRRLGDVLPSPTRGATWLSGACRLWSDECLPAAIGSGEFTVHFDLRFPTSVSATCTLFVVGANALSTGPADGLIVDLDTGRLRVTLRNGAGTAYEYRYGNFLTAYGGARGILTIRSDRTNGRFDIFWNGEPAIGGDTGTVAGAGTVLASWVGAGQDVGIINAAAVENCATFFGAMFWASRLTDAEIAAIVEAEGPVTTAPVFWWDFSAGTGRLVRDLTGNERNAIFANTNPNQYSIGAGPTWTYRRQSISPQPVIAGLDVAASLVPGDDILATMASNRDWLLPAASRVGDQVRITVNTTATIRVTQAASQLIRSGASVTTTGTGGALTIPNRTSVTLMCVAANTEWIVVSHTGAALTFT